MGSKIPPNTLELGREARRMWKQIDPKMVFGKFTLAMFNTMITAAEEADNIVQANEVLLVGQRTTREGKLEIVWDGVKRIRTGVKSSFGDDSTEYGMVGGTRKSDRKRPSRKKGAKAPDTSTPTSPTSSSPTDSTPT